MTKKNPSSDNKIVTAAEKRSQLLNLKKNAFAKNNTSANKFLSVKSTGKHYKHVRKK